MSVKSLHDTIVELSSTGKVAARLKSLEAVKSKSVEWPETVDEFSRLIQVVCDCVRQGACVVVSPAAAGKSMLVLGLGSLDVLIGEFSAAISESNVSSSTSVCGKLFQLLGALLSDPTCIESVQAHEGAFEYICRILRGFFSGLLARACSPAVTAALTQALLEFPLIRPRHQEMVKSTAWMVLCKLTSDFSLTQTKSLLQLVTRLFAKASKLTDMQFNVLLVSFLCERAPLHVRKTLTETPDLIRQIFSQIASFFPDETIIDSSPATSSSPTPPPTTSLLLTSVQCLRQLSVLITSVGIEFFPPQSPDLALLDACLLYNIRRASPGAPAVGLVRQVDLLIDIRILRYGDFLSIFSCAEEDVISARTVERWTSHSWKNPFTAKTMLEEAIQQGKLLTVSAILSRVACVNVGEPRVIEVASSALCGNVCLECPEISVSGNLPDQMRAVLVDTKKVFRQYISTVSGSKPALLAFYNTLSRIYSACNLPLLEIAEIVFGDTSNGLADRITTILTVEGSAEFTTKANLLLSFSSLISETQQDTILTHLSKGLHPRQLIDLITLLVSNDSPTSPTVSPPESIPHTCAIPTTGKPSICDECVDNSVWTLRESLALRGLPLLQRPAADEVTPPTAILSQALSLVSRLLTQSNLSHESLCSILGVYVLLGSLNISVRYDACVVTRALALASQSPNTLALSQLKSCLREASEFLATPVRLCQCTLHVDSLGEPRSLLSQAPVAVGTFFDDPSSSQTARVGRRSPAALQLRSTFDGRLRSVTRKGRCEEVRVGLKNLASMGDREKLELVKICLRENMVGLSAAVGFLVSTTLGRAGKSELFLTQLGLVAVSMNGLDEGVVELLQGMLFNMGELPKLSLSKLVVPVLFSMFNPIEVIRDIIALPIVDVGVVALRISASVHAPTQILRVEILKPLFESHPEYVLDAIDHLKASPAVGLAATRLLVARLVATTSIPTELAEMISEDLNISNLVSAIRAVLNLHPASPGSIGDTVARVLQPDPNSKRVALNQHSALDVLMLAKDVVSCCPTAQLRDPLSVVQSTVGQLNDRHWFMKLFVGDDELGEPLAKRTRRDQDDGVLLGTEFVCAKMVEFMIGDEFKSRVWTDKIITTTNFFLFALTFLLQGQDVLLIYALQDLVRPDLTSALTSFLSSVRGRVLSGPDLPDPINLKLTLTPAPTDRVYPTSKLSALVVDILEVGTLSALSNAVATNPQLAAALLPLLLLRSAALGESHRIAEIINSHFTDQCPTISQSLASAISLIPSLERSWGSPTVFPSETSILFPLVSRITLCALSSHCLRAKNIPESFFLAQLSHYIAAPPTSTRASASPVSTLDSLTALPTQSLVLTLESLEAMGTRLNSFPLSVHSSIRPLVAKLRGDNIALLHEGGVSFDLALTQLGVTKKISALGEWPQTDEPLDLNKVESIKQRLLGGGQTKEELKETVHYLSAAGVNTFTPPGLTDVRVECLSLIVREMRRLGQLHAARMVADFASEAFPAVSPAPRMLLMYHRAQTLWALDQREEAAALIAAIARSSTLLTTTTVGSSVGAKVCSRAVEWIGALRLESIEEIRSKYFASSLALADQRGSGKTAVKAKIRFVRVIDGVEGTNEESGKLLCEILVSGFVQSRDAKWFASRLVSLWFGSPTVLLGKHRSVLAESGYLLPFFYQIVGRIGGTESSFRKEHLLFILESAKKFPSICLPPILQLRNSTGVGAKTLASAVNARMELERSKQAEILIEKLRQSIPGPVDAMAAAFKFYLNLAMLKPGPVTLADQAGDPAGGRKKSMAAGSPGLSGDESRNVKRIDGYAEYAKAIMNGSAVLLTHSPAGGVDLLVGGIDGEFAIADSGKSLPKILTVIDSSGKRHKQIVKGNDDLRNDAVLQQLFGLIESVRTYKVVPIAACAGVAEWVHGTVTMGSFLAGYPNESTGAHARYFPDDLLPSAVKTKLVMTRQQLASSQGKLTGSEKSTTLHAAYTTLSERFRPVMRYFFFEHFATPAEWVRAQSVYAHSVAATSMLGFVVGLGDRHPNNVLLDVNSGHVVHIDYGICFDAGKFLKIPEIVPFRLTRDVVDGLGSLGTQGPFAKLCEDSLRFLKDNSALVTAVVEVFVADPLFNWAVASLGSDTAVAALNGVKRKLQGFLEASDVLPLSPSAQVDRLVRLASDPKKLSQMFAGWQPYL